MRSLKINIFIWSLITVFILLGCSKKEIPPKANDSGYIQIEQGKLFYQKFGSGGIPIIVLHGGPGLDQTYLQPQMLALAKNHEVIFYDQRGAGKSLEPNFSPAQINIEQFTKDLEELRKQLKLDKFILLGHSWGGLLAMNYSVNYPEHLAGLILLSTTPADYAGQQAYIEEFAKRTLSIKNEITPLFDHQAFRKLSSSQISKLYRTIFSVYFYDPQNVAKLNLSINKESAIGGDRVREIMMKTSNPNTNLFAQLTKLNVPSLVIHGQQDIIPLWTAQKIKNTIPDAQILILKKCGHFPYIEKPNELFDQINYFLELNKIQ